MVGVVFQHADQITLHFLCTFPWVFCCRTISLNTLLLEPGLEYGFAKWKMKTRYITTSYQTILFKSIHVLSHQRLFCHTWSTFEYSDSETQLGETAVPSFLDGRHKPQIAIEDTEAMLLSCLAIKTANNSIDVSKATCTLWTSFLIMQITQIKSVNTHHNEGLSKKSKWKKIIVFGWSSIKWFMKKIFP